MLQWQDFLVVGPGGVLTFNVSAQLVRPTGLKHAFARKGQFRKLSNLPLLPDKPIAVDLGVDPIHLRQQPRPCLAESSETAARSY
jgi:hypothetical protein